MVQVHQSSWKLKNYDEAVMRLIVLPSPLDSSGEFPILVSIYPHVCLSTGEASTTAEGTKVHGPHVSKGRTRRVTFKEEEKPTRVNRQNPESRVVCVHRAKRVLGSCTNWLKDVAVQIG